MAESKGGKVLVTGSSGFIGSRLAHSLLDEAEVLLWDRDILEIRGFREPTDTILHLAARLRAGPDAADIANLYRVNVGGTSAVMEYAKRTGAHCVFVSTSAVYRPTEPGKLLREDCEARPVGHYGLSKLAAEEECRRIGQEFNLRVTLLRLFNVYGEGQSDDFLIPQMFDAISRGRELRLRKPGAIRDYIHVSDVVEAIKLARFSHAEQLLRTINVGTGVGLSVREVGLLCQEVSGKPLFSVSDAGEASQRDSVVADTTRSRFGLGWRPKVSLEEGLSRCFASGKEMPS